MKHRTEPFLSNRCQWVDIRVGPKAAHNEWIDVLNDFFIFFPFSTLNQRQWVTFESVIGWLASTHRPYGAKHEPRSFEIPSFCLDDFVCVVSSCSKQVDALHSHLRIGMSNDIISADEPSEKRWRQRQQRANCDCDRTVSADWMMRRRLINSQIWLLCH